MVEPVAIEPEVETVESEIVHTEVIETQQSNGISHEVSEQTEEVLDEV